MQAMAEKDNGRAAAEHADAKGTHTADKKDQKPRAKTAYQVSMPTLNLSLPICDAVMQPERPYTPVMAAFSLRITGCSDLELQGTDMTPRVQL